MNGRKHIINQIKFVGKQSVQENGYMENRRCEILLSSFQRLEQIQSHKLTNCCNSVLEVIIAAFKTFFLVCTVLYNL